MRIELSVREQVQKKAKEEYSREVINSLTGERWKIPAKWGKPNAKKDGRLWLSDVFLVLDSHTKQVKTRGTELIDDLKVVQDEIERKVYDNPQQVFDRVFDIVSCFIKDLESENFVG